MSNVALPIALAKLVSLPELGTTRIEPGTYMVRGSAHVVLNAVVIKHPEQSFRPTLPYKAILAYCCCRSKLLARNLEKWAATAIQQPHAQNSFVDSLALQLSALTKRQGSAQVNGEARIVDFTEFESPHSYRSISEALASGEPEPELF